MTQRQSGAAMAGRSKHVSCAGPQRIAVWPTRAARGVAWLLALAAMPTFAATITVTTTAMSIDAGTCTDAANDIEIVDLPGTDTFISLPEAICAANSTAGADTIVLADDTYTLSGPHNYWYGPTGLPAVYSEIVIEGNGAVIERDVTAGTPKFRLFYVAGELHPVLVGGSVSPGSLMLRDLTLRNGLAKGGSSGRGGAGAGLGGAIYNQGTLRLQRVTASGNVAEGGDSGVSNLGDGGAGLGGGCHQQWRRQLPRGQLWPRWRRLPRRRTGRRRRRRQRRW